MSSRSATGKIDIYYFLSTVIQKVATPPTDTSDEDNLLPQWAVAMITIGLLSLVCVILFGVAVVRFLCLNFS